MTPEEYWRPEHDMHWTMKLYDRIVLMQRVCERSRRGNWGIAADKDRLALRWQRYQDMRLRVLRWINTIMRRGCA